MNRALNHVPMRVPSEGEFPDDDEYMPDPALDALLMDVISAYEALEHIEQHGIRIAVRWRQKGGRSKGKLVYSKCQKPSGLLRHFAGVDFVIWLAADNIQVESWSTVQIGKLLYHECRYIGWDEGDDEHDPHPVLLAHDVELFYGELTDTGAWERRRETVAREVLAPGFVERSQDR